MALGPKQRGQHRARRKDAAKIEAITVNVLVLNAGSSSLKYRLMRMDSAESVLTHGLVEAVQNFSDAVVHAIEHCKPLGIGAVGHRVVHGGPRFREPVRITPEVIAAIRQASDLAPLHNDQALVGIETAQRLLPDKPSVAVFDTGFHATIPDVAGLYAIPTELVAKHALRRYGFHGISHRFVSQRLIECLHRPAAGTRLITCHLGNGASICAIRDGKSIDTSMGLTPMEGLVMGTRSGDIDPGLVLYLMTGLGMSAQQVDDLLNHRSGLAGVSGISGDLREVERAADTGNKQAELAIQMFAYRVRKYIGAYAAALGGVDAIAFAGGIGEHSAPMRQRICAGLEWLGIWLDRQRNGDAKPDAICPIHVERSVVGVWVVPTDEEQQIAREVRDLLRVD
jgi:acetate kinase